MGLRKQIEESEMPEDVITDPVYTATKAGLEYLTDTIPGITRHKRLDKWIYKLPSGERCKDPDTLARIKSLVLPPAWTSVWISPIANGHLQATGIDKLGRKQYKYHEDWNRARNESKFNRLLKFGETLPLIRKKVERDLAKPGFVFKKIMALVISIMERTFIRIGNSAYEKLYGSYGLTTLQNKHVKVNGATVTFNFKGKKGVFHDIRLQSRKLAGLVKKCLRTPGRSLFQYLSDRGIRHRIDSGNVNNYLKEITGFDFTAKDFRTWAGSVNALKAFREIVCTEKPTVTAMKRDMVKVIDMVSKQLGNTRAICKKYYIHPVLFSVYENGFMRDYMNELDLLEETDGGSGLSREERILMKILKAEGTGGTYN